MDFSQCAGLRVMWILPPKQHSALRLEEIINHGKIIRPAYMNICPAKQYIPFEERKIGRAHV